MNGFGNRHKNKRGDTDFLSYQRYWYSVLSCMQCIFKGFQAVYKPYILLFYWVFQNFFPTITERNVFATIFMSSSNEKLLR